MKGSDNRKKTSTGKDRMQSTALCHALGKRPTQEDTYLNYTVTDIENSEQAKCFLESFHKSTFECTKDYTTQGSCAISTVYLPKTKQVIWSNLGDSQATIFVWRAESQFIECKVLNKLHKPSYHNKFKCNVVESTKGSLTLSVSRAYGDKDFIREAFSDILQKPFSQDPDYDSFDLSTLNLSDGDRAFLMTSCDGYFEAYGAINNYQSAISELLQGQPEVTIEEVLQACFNEAKAKSYDNLTAFLTELTDKKIENSAIVSQVFDGHGGSEVSRAIVHHALKNILSDKVKFLVVHSSEDILLGSVMYAFGRLATLSAVALSANILMRTTQNNILSLLGSVVTPILCEYYIHNDKNKQMTYLYKTRHFADIQMFDKIPLLNKLELSPPIPTIRPLLWIAGFYLCNTYIAPQLFAGSDQLSQALISTTISVSASTILSVIIDNISFTK